MASPNKNSNKNKSKKKSIRPAVLFTLLILLALGAVTVLGFYQSNNFGFSFPLQFSFLNNGNEITPPIIQSSSTEAVSDDLAGTKETALKVIHPNNGGGFVVGQPMPIVWKNYNLPLNSSIDTIDITILGTNGLEYPVPIIKSPNYIDGFSGYFNSKGYSTYLGYLVKTYVPAGDGYRLKVRCLNCDSLVQDTSDGTFRIIPASRTPLINFIYPSFGDTVAVGSTINIRWRTANIKNDTIMDLELYEDKKGGLARSIVVNDPTSLNDGSQSFIIPSDLEPGSYKIQISCRDCVDSYGYNPSQWGGAFNIIRP